MKKIVILLAVLFVSVFSGLAQNNTSGNYNRNGEQYVATYYMPMLWGTNGFRTVEQENRIMEQELAALRRQRQLEDMTPEERAQLRKRHDIKLEIKNDALAAKKEKEEAKKQKAQETKQPAKKDTVLARKDEPKKKK